jgi:hypothetical protein
LEEFVICDLFGSISSAEQPALDSVDLPLCASALALSRVIPDKSGD